MLVNPEAGILTAQTVNAQFIESGYNIVDGEKAAFLRGVAPVLGQPNLHAVTGKDRAPVRAFTARFDPESQYSLVERESRFEIDCGANGTGPGIEIAHDRLLQVLLNLLDNALDASRDVSHAVVVRIGKEAERPFIEVEDQGCGIRDEDLPRVFDPFFTSKDVGEGTGLGLYVSYEIMRHLGGSIDVASIPGRGTKVRITLPGSEVTSPRTPEE